MSRFTDTLNEQIASEFGASMPGIATGTPASRRYCTIIMAWFRSSTACW